jgi:uncharacterized protein (TIGR03435 family)
MKHSVFSAVILAFTPAIVFGQALSAPPAFEVASVKPSTPGSSGGGITPGPDGLTAHNVTLLFCIRIAYDVQEDQVSGPGWMSSEQYDMSAKAGTSVGQDQLRLMLQTLLADRFRLAFHREATLRSVYTLLVGKAGANLHEPTNDGGGGITAEVGHLAFKGASMQSLTRRLSQQLHAPVSDMTGLKGLYDFTLDWQQDENVPGASIFTAVQEQLGLRLEAKKAPVEILIIDHADKVPTAN